MNVISIHQPCFMPWIGFFHKMICSDHFVLLDHVQFTKDGYDNRVQIKGIEENRWITVPVYKNGRSRQIFKDTEIDNSTNWNLRQLRIIKQSYCRAAFFECHWAEIEKILSSKWRWLIDLNLSLIRFFCELFHIKCPSDLSSRIYLGDSKNSAMNEKIVSSLNGTIYFSGIMGKEYLNEKEFNQKGIKIIYQNINYPAYKQLGSSFVPGLSIIDQLFNCGAEAVIIYLNDLRYNFLNSLNSYKPEVS